MLKIFLSLDDSHIGRFDYSTLPDQALFELLVDNFGSSSVFRDEMGNYKDIADIREVKLDETGSMEFLELDCGYFSGTLDMHLIPQNVKKLDLSFNCFFGKFSCELIPPCTRCVALQANSLTGSVDLGKLSECIQILTLSSNKLSGTVNFPDIPKNLIALDLYSNKLSGSIDLRHLRQQLKICDNSVVSEMWKENPNSDKDMFIRLSYNDFEGDILVNDIYDVIDFVIFEAIDSQLLLDASGKKINLSEF